MSNITIFENEQFGSLRITDYEGNFWFVARDVAIALGYSDPRKAVSTHCKKVKSVSLSDTPGSTATNIIPESEVYRLIMKSKLPNAEAFQDWVVEEVLPSIRKTGAYKIKEEKPVKKELPHISKEFKAAKALAKMVGLEGNQAIIRAANLVHKRTGFNVITELEITMEAEDNERLLTATEIGKLHFNGLSAIKVNLLLQAKGLQEKDDKAWKPIGQGIHYGVLCDNVKRGSGGSVQTLKWKESVVAVLVDDQAYAQ